MSDEQLEELQQEMVKGHRRFQEMNPLADSLVGALEESQSAFFGPGARGAFAED